MENTLKNKPVLVVMAAGMGSRFGGLKQAEPITPNGRGILDFTCFDARNAGFEEVVFIIRKDIEKDFKEIIGNRIEKKMKVSYVFQDTSCLPEGRTKPFGTAHAILCCKEVVKGPFAIVNADDYYGSNAFNEIFKFLSNSKEGEYAIVAYEVGNTLSKNGTVSRGVCTIENGLLKDVVEVLKIDPEGKCEMNGKEITLAKNTPVSMNLFGFTNNLFGVLEKEYEIFKREANLLKDEFLIPSIVGKIIKQNIATVKVLTCSDRWYGITYREDLEEVKEVLNGYIKEGKYPNL